MINDIHKEGLKAQISESYAQVIYTYTTHLKMANSLINKYKMIKWIQILLSAVTTGGIIASLFSSTGVYNIISSIFSSLLLFTNLYFKNFDHSELALKHKQIADELWPIREEYKSCLTDFNCYNNEEIIRIRDKLIIETSEIYKKAPLTDRKSYKKAQKALKKEEEQYFSLEELNSILPMHLRNNKEKNSEKLRID